MPPPLALPLPGRSFYDVRSNARPFIARAHTSEDQENPDPTLTAWQLVVQACFPSTEDIPNESKTAAWTVVHDTHVPTASAETLDTAEPVRKLLKVRLHVVSTGDLSTTEHDVVTIECGSPRQKSVEGWKTLVEASAERLVGCTSLQEQLLIVAIGSDFVLFTWDRDRGDSSGASTQGSPSGVDEWTLRLDKRLQPLSTMRSLSRGCYIENGGGDSGQAIWPFDFDKAQSLLVTNHEIRSDAVDLESVLLQARRDALVEHGVLAPT